MSRKQPFASRRTPTRTVGIVLSAAILAASGIGYATATEVTSQIKHVDVFSLVKNRPTSDGGQNILLVGSDDRAGLSPKERRKLHVGQGDYGSHAEPIMIVHVADDGSVGVVSIPRDSLAEIPTYVTSSGSTIAAHKGKINSAFGIGGAGLTVSAIEQTTGVHIDHYAQVDFLGFVNMVNALGGVPVCFKKAVTDEKAGLKLPAGTTVLDGKQALAYVRARYIDGTSDYGRMKRQQTFIGSVFNQVMSPAVLLNPARLMSFMNGAAASVTTDTGFNQEAIWKLMAQLRGLSPSSLTFTTVPTTSQQVAGVGDVEVFDQPKSDEIFDRLNSGQRVIDKSQAAPAADTVEVAPRAISVRIYNGSSISGLGAKASKEMREAGYDVVGAPENWQGGSPQTVIEYDPSYDTSLKTLEAAFPGVQVREVEGLGKTFRLIVGPEYSGVTAVTAKSAPPVPPTAPLTPDTPSAPKTAADDICDS